MISKIAFLDLKGSLMVFIILSLNLDLMNNMEIANWISYKKYKIIDLSIIQI